MIPQEQKMEALVSLCKRRGFIFPSSEIYGGFAAVYDYGPYGVELINTLKREWWRAMVQRRSDVVGLDSAIFMHPKIWEASGHVAGFSDPLTECKTCHARLRADHLLEEIGVEADEKMDEASINELLEASKDRLRCPKCGQREFTPVKKFNLLVQSNLGNFTGDWTKEPVYLRGETCQGIYVNYKNILDSMRVKVPFGIAQIGKAFRNEITARQFVFRTREFEQMEMQYFTSPAQEMEEYERLRAARWQFYLDLGMNPGHIRWHEHERLVFYAKRAFDIEYEYPFGWKELEGVHARGDYDLTQHAKFSGQALNYLDPYTQERYVPHIVESSVGVGRMALAFLSEAFAEEELADGESRMVLRFHPRLAPIKMAVMPLQKKDGLSELAETLATNLRRTNFMIEYDEGGSIGKRYRRQDEIGTPWCVTVDYQTKEDGTVTIRERDAMTQTRIALQDVPAWLQEHMN